MVAGIGKNVGLVAVLGGTELLSYAINRVAEYDRGVVSAVELREALEGQEVIIVDEVHMPKREDIYKRPPPPERPTPKKREPKPEIDLTTWRSKQGREIARRLRQMQRRLEKTHG